MTETIDGWIILFPEDTVLENNSFSDRVVSVSTDESVFDKAFAAYSVVIVGTSEENGETDLAPKHMVTPLGHSNYFGFVCNPSHHTFQNVQSTGEFTISYPRPNQIVSVSLAAEPRNEADQKPDLDQLETIDAPTVDAEFVRDSYIYLECELDSISDPFGDDHLIVGNVIDQYVHKDVARSAERDDAEIIDEHPILCYLHPGRYAEIHDSQAFPFPRGFQE